MVNDSSLFEFTIATVILLFDGLPASAIILRAPSLDPAIVAERQYEVRREAAQSSEWNTISRSLGARASLRGLETPDIPAQKGSLK
jgi:hypothetical protein